MVKGWTKQLTAHKRLKEELTGNGGASAPRLLIKELHSTPETCISKPITLPPISNA
jgi:hypothetical protein